MVTHPISSTTARTPDPPEVRRCEILGVPIDLVDYDTAFAMIQDWRASRSRQFVVIETAADIQLSRDAGLREASRRAGLNLPDGVGIVIAARLLGQRTRGRVTGPELMLRVCDWGRAYGFRHYFYGSTPDVVQRLEERLTQCYPGLGIAGSYCPPFRTLTPEEEERVVTHINSCQPDVVWVGLGGPKQIRWMADHLGQIAAPVMIGVGAAFNFHSGVVKRAPLWMRRLGIEWVYRTLTEPRKIVPRTRYTLMFCMRAVAQAAAWRLAGRSRSLGRWQGRAG
jgi:N-acetylglucosaminyldiphosphoundecaprenol N-acetyl-beta-D-mannosaminyltransferase